MNHRSVYLDYSATTPTDPRVVDAMMPYFTDIFGNASSAHQMGRKSESAIEKARQTVATILNCNAHEIIFTGCGSESDNLAVRGIAWDGRTRGRNHLVTTPIEHSAIGRTIEQLTATMGFTASYIPVTPLGHVEPHQLANVLTDETSLVSIIYANNEVGTVQSFLDIVPIVHNKGAVLHTDAVQAAGQLSLDVQQLGVDLMSISAHKFYGPKGVGALYVRSGVKLVPHLTGGSHEHGIRAGTQNTAFIVGLATALQLAYDELPQRQAIVQARQQQLVETLLSRLPQAQLTGDPIQRLPSHASFIIAGIDANKLIMHLDLKGVAASSASACKVGNPEPSSVLRALGYSPELAKGSLRLSVSHHTSEEDIAYAVQTIVESVNKLYAMQHNRSQ